MLTFQPLDVYRCAIELVAKCAPLRDGLPRGQAALADPLRRAAIWVPLNIAEAAGRTGAADKVRTNAIARGSAMECAAVTDVFLATGIIDESVHDRGSDLRGRVVAMLTKLCR